MEEIRKQLIRHVKSVNKHLKQKWCEEQSNRILLCYTHPDDRKRYEILFNY